MRKYDADGTTTVDVFMDGGLVLSSAYASIVDDANGAADNQGFASGSLVPTSSVNIDYVNFTLYDNLTESIPEPSTSSPF